MNPNTPNEAIAAKNTKKPHEKRTYTFKQKLLPSILLSLAIPLTVCLFGPFDIYYGNMDIFRYSLGDFVPLCIAGALFFACLFFALLMVLKGRAYEIASAVILALSLLLFVQRSFLNGGVDALQGDGVGTYGAGLIPTIINTLIWVAVISGFVVAAIIFRKKSVEIVETVTVIAMITLIGMQAVTMVIYSVTTDVWTPVDERKQISNEEVGKTDVLTFDGFTELSAENNVVVFIVDRFDSSYYDKFVETNPNFFEGLDGFTYFNDYTTLYSRTYPAVTSILTGLENDFSSTRLDYFKNAYADGGAMKFLKEKGYDISLHTKEYYAYENAEVMGDYVDNVTAVTGYYIDEHFLLAADMVRLSFSTYLPFVAKGTMGYMDTAGFNDHAKYILENKDGGEDVIPYDSDLKVVKDYIDGSTFETVNGKGKFTFIHLDGCHTPLKYDEEWNNIWSDDTDIAILLNFEIILAYIQQMKDLGIYEDSTIVITGDHAWSVDDYMLIGESTWENEVEPSDVENETESESESESDSDETEETEDETDDIPEIDPEEDRGVRVTSMFFKPRGESGEAMKTSTAQISQDELWNTILVSEGLIEDKNVLTFYNVPEGEDRERRYFLQVSAKLETNNLEEDYIFVYKITGTALDPENWEVDYDKSFPVGDMYK